MVLCITTKMCIPEHFWSFEQNLMTIGACLKFLPPLPTNTHTHTRCKLISFYQSSPKARPLSSAVQCITDHPQYHLWAGPSHITCPIAHRLNTFRSCVGANFSSFLLFNFGEFGGNRQSVSIIIWTAIFFVGMFVLFQVFQFSSLFWTFHNTHFVFSIVLVCENYGWFLKHIWKKN